MNYAQEIEQIENRNDIQACYFELLTLAKKMQYQIEAKNTRIMELQSTINYYNDFKKEAWIPCGERLPEKPTTYQVTFEYGDGFRQISDATFYCDKTWGKAESKERKVIAWMSLPEPYGGDL